MNDQPWYATFFGEDYLRIYQPFLPPEKTQQEVESIIELLNLQPGSHILDLCCGHGRHAIPLALRGYQVTGLDLSSTLIQQAQADAVAQGVTTIHWLQNDMRSIPFENKFDAIINIFTSFGYLPDNEDQKVLQQIQKALKPGGLLLLETVYQPKVVRNASPHGIIRYNDGLVVLEERHIDLLHSRNEVHISMIYPNGKRVEHTQSIRIYTLTELIQMLEQASFQVQSYYGGLDGSALTLDSRLVIISRKQT